MPISVQAWTEFEVQILFDMVSRKDDFQLQWRWQ